MDQEFHKGLLDKSEGGVKLKQSKLVPHVVSKVLVASQMRCLLAGCGALR